MPVHVRIIIILIFSLMLTGCAELAPATPIQAIIPETSAAPTAGETGTATPDTGVPVTTPASTPTAEPIPTAIIEPALPLPQVDPAIPPINPPDFSQIPEMSNSGPFDLVDAHAVYAIYRQQVGPNYWATETFIAEMENYLKSQGLTLVQADGNGVSYSLLTRQTDQGWETLLGSTPEGALAHMQPGLWGEGITQQWVPVSPVLKGPPAIFIGADKQAYIGRTGVTDNTVYDFFNPPGAKVDNLAEQWVPVRDGQAARVWDVDQGAWVKNYDTTEYEGIFSEKYGDPEFTDSFTYTHESGIEVPIHIGLDIDGLPGSADDLPIKEVHLTELGQELLAIELLAASYHRYTEYMGNDVTFDEYLELVQNGQGQVEINYFDEQTGQKKTGLYDLRNGVSIVVTHRDDMPLVNNPNSAYPTSYYFSMNKNGQLILVQEWDKKLLEHSFERDVQEKSGSEGFFYSFEIIAAIRSALFFLAAVDSESFANNGQTLLTGIPIMGEKTRSLNIEAFGSSDVNPQAQDSTLFAQIVIK